MCFLELFDAIVTGPLHLAGDLTFWRETPASARVDHVHVVRGGAFDVL